MSRFAEKTRVFLELVKFEHSIFALPYAYIGALYGAASIPVMWTAGGWAITGPFAGSQLRLTGVTNPSDYIAPGNMPTWQSLFWITVVMVGARAFAFVVNRAVDKEIDARNPRTAGRAIPAGMVNAWELWVFALAMLAIYIYGVFQLAPVTHYLWPIPLIAFVVYPYTKRFTPLCHYWLGLCLGLAPIGGWVAVGGWIGDPAPWFMGLAVLLWTAGFDIIYATQDVDCDVRDGVHSMPADFGVGPALVQTRIDHLLTIVFLVVGGVYAAAGWPWYLGVAIAAALLLYENAIVSARDLTRVNAAFFTINGIIAVVVGLGAFIDRLLA